MAHAGGACSSSTALRVTLTPATGTMALWSSRGLCRYRRLQVTTESAHCAAECRLQIDCWTVVHWTHFVSCALITNANAII